MEWVGRMNSIRSRAEKIVLNDLIYNWIPKRYSVCFNNEAGAYFCGINFAATPLKSVTDMASILLPQPDFSSNLKSKQKNFSRGFIFRPFSWSTTWGGFQKISEAPIKTGLFIPYLVKGTENFLPEGLIFRSSRDLPLEGRNFSGGTRKNGASHS